MYRIEKELKFNHLNTVLHQIHVPVKSRPLKNISKIHENKLFKLRKQ